MVQRVVLPPGASNARLRQARARLNAETVHTKLQKDDAKALGARVRTIIASRPSTKWTVRDHALVMGALRSAATKWGAKLSVGAELASHAAARVAIDHAPRVLRATGQAITDQPLRPIPLDGDAAFMRALPTLQARTFQVGARSGEDVGTVAASTSLAAVQEELGAAEVAERVALAVEARAWADAERVIATEMTAAMGIALEAAAEQWVPLFQQPLLKVWDATLDRRVCVRCSELHSVAVPIDKAFPGGLDEPPAHARCLPPGERIATPQGEVPIESVRVGDQVVGGTSGLPRAVGALSRSAFDGELVRLRVGDRTLRLTPNHPVLVEGRGWVDAGTLQLGDKLLRHEREHGIFGADLIAAPTQDRPPGSPKGSVLLSVDTELYGCPMPAARVDLDSCALLNEREVDVPRVERELRREDESCGCQRIRENPLDGRGSTNMLPRESLLALFVVGLLHAADSIVRGLGEALAALGAFVGHAHERRGATPALAHAVVAQGSNDAAALNAHPTRDREHRFPAIDVGADNFQLVDRRDLFPRHKPNTPTLHDESQRAESRECCCWGDVERACDRPTRRAFSAETGDLGIVDLLVCSHAHAMPVRLTPTDITSIERERYVGDVFNFSVAVDESYVAGGVVVHNCRCVAQAWLADWGSALVDLGIAPGPRGGVQEEAETPRSTFDVTVLAGD